MILLKSFDSKQVIGDIHVLVDIQREGESESRSTLQYVRDDGILKIMLDPGRYELTLRVDDIKTPGKDFYLTQDILVPAPPAEFFLLSAGSVRGRVLDRGGLAVPRARVISECSSSGGNLAPVESDDLGTYRIDWLPIGVCHIKALDGASGGDVQVEVRGGSLVSQDIVLGQKVPREGALSRLRKAALPRKVTQQMTACLVI